MTDLSQKTAPGLHGQGLASQVLEAALDAIVSVDRHGRIVGFNPAAERLFGRQRCAVLGKDMAPLIIPPELRERHLRAFTRHLRSGNARILGRRLEFEALHTDGRRIPVELCVTRQEMRDGPVFTAFLRDLSERHAMEKALRESETRYRLVAEHTGQLIYDYNLATGRIEWRGAIQALTGYTSEEFAAMDIGVWEQHLHPEDRDKALARLASARASGGKYEADYRFRRRDGRYIEVHDSGAFLRDETGRVHRMLGTMRDMTTLNEYERRMRYAAEYDDLTELPNRARFLRAVNTGLERARQQGGGLALLTIDLDGFRGINDSLGPRSGDALLRAVSQRLRSLAPAQALVARLGSDEFGVMLETSRERAPALRLIRDIQNALAEGFHLDELDISASACIGVSFFPRDGSDANTLMLHADAALYRAKAHGRGSFMLFQHDMARQTLESVMLASSLRRAVERGELELHYQPIVSLQDLRVVGVEALARWTHPRHGQVSPARFIGVAEEIGLIGEIGSWALSQACRQGRRWLDQGLPPIHIAVNVSARQLADPRFVERVETALEEEKLPPELLTIELTESLMQAGDRTTSVLHSLREMGVQVAVDDFGTGYSSLSYLARLPIDYLKIDRAFVGYLPEDRSQASITRAIIAMAKSLELGLVAEGVETEAQRQFLLRHDCREGQGYLFSQPLPAAGLERYLRGEPETDHLV